MGSQGSQGPRPYEQHRASTAFLRVPSDDWARVTQGHKTEFRASSRAVSNLWSVELPTPVVAYRVRPGPVGGHDASLMVLEDRWMEPLGSISPESLAAEGFETFAEFRRYWMIREKRHFPMTRMTTVYRVRPWRESDRREMADMLLERLYGEHLATAH